MIRGTNKRIIEINGEDGSCFERIVVFLRPEQAGNEDRMLKMAESYADGIFRSTSTAAMLEDRPPKTERRFPGWKLLAASLLALGTAGTLAIVLLLLL